MIPVDFLDKQYIAGNKRIFIFYIFKETDVKSITNFLLVSTASHYLSEITRARSHEDALELNIIFQ